jgi:hypothetical protein
MAEVHKRCISVTKEDDEFMARHPEINFSGLVRSVLKEVREKEEARKNG